MKYDIRVDGEKFSVEVKSDETKGGERVFKVDVGGREFEVAVKQEAGAPEAAKKRPSFSVSGAPPAQAAAPKSAKAAGESAPAGGGVPIESPMAGKVARVSTKVGASVKPGDVLFILEAMKMENSITATVAGKVNSISVDVGDLMQKGDVMCTIG